MIAEFRQDLLRSLRRNMISGVAASVVFLGGVASWAATANLSSAVIASGILVVDGNAKKVQHQSGGIVAELLVKEGEHVKTGSPLLRLDNTVIEAKRVSISSTINQLYARQARLQAESDGAISVNTPRNLLDRLNAASADRAMQRERRLFADRGLSRDGQKARLRERILQLRNEIEGLEEQQRAKRDEIDLIDKELEGTRRLYDKGIIPLNRVNTLDRNVARLRGERGQITASIAAAKGKIAETDLELIQIDRDLRAEVATELRDVEINLTDFIGQEVKAYDDLKRVEIIAPIDGVVHGLAIHTVSGVISPAEVLMEIVPNHAELMVEARVGPQDIDQLEIGQSAVLRLSAFNRNTTPELFGTLSLISPDLETDKITGAVFYRIDVRIPPTEYGRIPGLQLIAGMPTEVFVRTRDRTIISYFTKPIIDHAQQALREE